MNGWGYTVLASSGHLWPLQVLSCSTGQRNELLAILIWRSSERSLFRNVYWLNYIFWPTEFWIPSGGMCSSYGAATPWPGLIKSTEQYSRLYHNQPALFEPLRTCLLAIRDLLFIETTTISLLPHSCPTSTLFTVFPHYAISTTLSYAILLGVSVFRDAVCELRRLSALI